MLRTLLTTSALTLALTGTASADSIVFVKDHDLFRAAPGGAAQRLTSDGTAGWPYRSPSQADDGTIAVAYKQGIRILRPDGALVRELDPPALSNSVGHPMDGAPGDVAISPNGRLVAFTQVSYECPVGADCGAREALGYMPTSGKKVDPSRYGGHVYTGQPSWVGNARTLSFSGYGHQVNVQDLGPGAVERHWFDDSDLVGQADATDLADGELSRQGDRLALVRNYGSAAHIAWLAVNGSGTPQLRCETSREEGSSSPSWAPDGRGLTFATGLGVYVVRGVSTVAGQCGTATFRLAYPGASEPDWGPAGTGAPRYVKIAPRVTGRPRLSTVLSKRGLRVFAKVPAAGKLRISGVVTAGGRRYALDPAAGPVAYADEYWGDLKPLKKHRAALRRAKSATVKLTVAWSSRQGRGGGTKVLKLKR